MRKYLEENNFKNIDFIQNNSYIHEDNIICGTRGWSADDKKITRRENARLELSLQHAVGANDSVRLSNKEIIVCMHYSPFNDIEELDMNFIHTMKKYNVKKCVYGHIHGEAFNGKKEGEYKGIEFKLVSSDYLNFRLIEV